VVAHGFRLLRVGGLGADLGGATVATRMVGGFTLVALLFCILLAWPGRRRWPLWLRGGLSSSSCGALALALSPVEGIRSYMGAPLVLALAFVALATVLDPREQSK
jgi:peptidoglycan/LPS O-acetylase OafA/YrhL